MSPQLSAIDRGLTATRGTSLHDVHIVKQEAGTAPRVRRSDPAIRATSPHEPYHAYKPRPFTREEREHVTMLFGGLHWRAERVIQGALENLGYRAQALPIATREDLLTGRELADVGQCCPTSFTVGNLANFLRAEVRRISAEEVARKYVYITLGSCGACRFGQYHESYELALRNIGLDTFRMFLLGQHGLDQGTATGGGLELDMPFTLAMVWAAVLTDIVQDIEYQTRPYEKNAGETDRVMRECVEFLYETFRRRPRRGKKWSVVLWYLATDYFAEAMREVCRRFAEIEVDRLRVKPLVKITGEFYLQTVEGAPNHNIHRWLETEGAEVYPAPITVWFDYLLRVASQEFEDHVGIDRLARCKLAGVRALQMLLRWTYSRMRCALNDVPRALPHQRDLRKLAAPYYHARLSGGEGDMLIGKALWAYHHKKAHMICELSPYSCMPNTMSVGSMGAVLGRYPDLLYAPLEIKGDAEVHALSRCQMILTEAKKRAQSEYAAAIERTGIRECELRTTCEAWPELRKATWRLPHYGVVGTAANLALHVAARRQSC